MCGVAGGTRGTGQGSGKDGSGGMKVQRKTGQKMKDRDGC